MFKTQLVAIGLLALKQPGQAAESTWYSLNTNCLIEDAFLKWVQTGGESVSAARSLFPKLPHTPDELIAFFKQNSGVSAIAA